MLRFLFRILSLFSLSVAVIMAVLDATRSLAVSDLVLTPLGASWGAVSPGTLAAASLVVEQRLDPLVWQLVAAPLIGLPGFVVFAGLAFVFSLIGQRPRRAASRFAA